MEVAIQTAGSRFKPCLGHSHLSPFLQRSLSHPHTHPLQSLCVSFSHLSDEVILLSAMGTAAIVNMRAPLPPQPSSAGSSSGILTVSLDRQEFQKEQQVSGTPPTTEIK